MYKTHNLWDYMLKIENTTMRFGGVVAVNNLSANIEKGELVGLIGPNGAGKTTVFNVVTGLYQPTEGRVLYNLEIESKVISDLRPDQIAKLGICRTFQNIRLFKELSVLDNVFIGNHLRIESGIISSVLKLPKYRAEEKSMLEKSKYLLEKVGLFDERDEKSF